MVFDDIRIALLEQNRQAPSQTELVDRYKSLLKRELADRLPEGVSPDTVVISLPPVEDHLADTDGSSPFDEPDFTQDQEVDDTSEESSNTDSTDSTVATDTGSGDIDIAGSEGLEDESLLLDSVEHKSGGVNEAEDKESLPGTTPRGGEPSKKRGGKLRRWRRN
jgi:hypothetical protein